MEREEISNFIEHKLKESLSEHKTELLTSMESLITKISDSSSSKISNMLNCGYNFKRKPSEEQFKYNATVNSLLDDADHLISSQKVEESRQKIAEGIYLVIIILLIIMKIKELKVLRALCGSMFNCSIFVCIILMLYLIFIQYS